MARELLRFNDEDEVCVNSQTDDTMDDELNAHTHINENPYDELSVNSPTMAMMRRVKSISACNYFFVFFVRNTPEQKQKQSKQQKTTKQTKSFSKEETTTKYHTTTSTHPARDPRQAADNL